MKEVRERDFRAKDQATTGRDDDADITKSIQAVLIPASGRRQFDVRAVGSEKERGVPRMKTPHTRHAFGERNGENRM